MLNEYPPCVNTEFAHTHDYADYWGVFFYARSTDGDWIDRLDISATYTDPIFDSIMHRFWRENDGVKSGFIDRFPTKLWNPKFNTCYFPVPNTL